LKYGYRRQLCDEGRNNCYCLKYSWLESQVNVSNAKSLKIAKATVSFTDYPTKEVEATISFINPEINLDSRLLLIRDGNR
jgi:Cu(I)/Ag(I) efflux system membrane fusion protein